MSALGLYLLAPGLAPGLASGLVEGAPFLGAGRLALAATLLLCSAGVSLGLSLGLERKLLWAAVRAVVQLALLGLVLEWVFARHEPGIVVALMVAMASLAGWEAVRRSRHRMAGVLPGTVAVMLGSSLFVTLFGVVWVLEQEPWYEPRFVIPVLGMVLGNTLNGVALGLDTLLAGLAEERARIETLLAHGATRREASLDLVRRAVRTGLIPILNSMMAVGVIAIPGMMTGQILSGETPGSAARYQVFILFLIAGGTALGTVGTVLYASRLAFDERERLRPERLRLAEPGRRSPTGS